MHTKAEYIGSCFRKVQSTEHHLRVVMLQAARAAASAEALAAVAAAAADDAA